MLNVLNINSLSLNNPKRRYKLLSLLTQMHPDIVVGSETWPHWDIHNAEIVPDDLVYGMFSPDRPSRGGGVLF